jgi:RHS repeat-associated protein
VGRIQSLAYPDGRAISFASSLAGSLMRISQTAAGLAYPGLANAAAARDLAAFRRVGGAASGIDFGPCTVALSHDIALRPVGADWRTANGGAPLAIERRLYGPRNESRVEQTGDRVRTSASDELGRQTSAEDRTGLASIDVSSLAPPATAAGLTDHGQALEDALPLPGPGVFARSVAYGLDGNSNRTTTTDVPANGALPEVNAYAVAGFDAYTKVGPDTVLSDSAGNIIGIGGKRFRYDPYHALAEIQVQGKTTALKRDGLGRLSHIQTEGSDLRFVYAGLDNIEWRVNGGTAGQVVRYGSRLCHLAAGSNDYVPLSDLSASIVGWVDPAGARSGSSLYDPFGKFVSRSGAWPAPFGFRGYWTDEMSGLALLHARAYDPALGRFLQRDPLGYADGTNLYAYAGHAPDRMTDEWGLSSVKKGWDPLVKTAVLVASGAAQIAEGAIWNPLVLGSRTQQALGTLLRRRGNILEYLAGNNPWQGGLGLAKGADQLPQMRALAIQWKSTDELGEIAQVSRDATRDAQAFIDANPLRAFLRAPQARLIVRTGTGQETAAAVRGALAGARSPIVGAAPPKLTIGLPGIVGLLGHALTIGGGGFSGYALYYDWLRKDTLSAFGNALGVESAGLWLGANLARFLPSMAGAGSAVGGGTTLTFAGLSSMSFGGSLALGGQVTGAFALGWAIGSLWYAGMEALEPSYAPWSLRLLHSFLGAERLNALDYREELAIYSSMVWTDRDIRADVLRAIQHK